MSRNPEIPGEIQRNKTRNGSHQSARRLPQWCEEASIMALDTLTVPAQDAAMNADLSDSALIKLRDLVYRISGIYHPENKFYLLATRSRRRMKALNSKTFADYLDHLTTRPNREAEMRSLLNEITIGETYFFRSKSQLEAVSKIILPKLMALSSKQAFKKLRFWSAGCSTGEEAYTLSILLLEQIAQKYKDWTFEITATDLNDNSIIKCREGLYAEYAVRNLSPERRQRFFKQEGNLYRVNDEVRARVKFERLNLQDQPAILFMKGFDLIFCCNVLIYFDGVAKRRTVDHFYNGLVPGGHLFLGECETLFGIYDQFRLVHFPGATAYYKPISGEASVASK
jgi:chemotaxis protein methyltransferase CheR